MHPVKSLHQTVELGIAQGAIDIMEGLFMCASAPFRVGSVTIDTSTLPSNSTSGYHFYDKNQTYAWKVMCIMLRGLMR